MNLFNVNRFGLNQEILEQDIRRKCNMHPETGAFELNHLRYPAWIRHFGGKMLAGIISRGLLRYPINPFPVQATVLVKSVHVFLSLPWLMSKFDFQPLVILRHPANIIQSYLRLELKDADRNIWNHEKILNGRSIDPEKPKSKLEKMAYQIGVFYEILSDYLDEDPGILTMKHEDLCKNTVPGFRELFEKMGLSWDSKVKGFIRDQQEEGSGFEIQRIPERQIQKYKNELTSEQIDSIKMIYQGFETDFGYKFQ